MYHTTSSAAWYGVQEQYTVLSSSIMHMRILSLGLPCRIEIYFFCRETKKRVTANGWLQGYTREEVGLVFLCWKKQGRIKKKKGMDWINDCMDCVVWRGLMESSVP